MERKKLLLILNPTAGQKRVPPFLPDIIRLFTDKGYATQVYVTAAQGDATAEVRSHAAEFDRIVCAGGDGTLNEVISGVLHSGVSRDIGYIPAGTTNDFASTLSLSSDIMKAAEDSVSDRVISYDLGKFNGRTFVYIASFGAFTRASYSTPQSLKNVLGHLAYILEGVKEVASLSPEFVALTTPDGQYIAGEYIFGSVSNSSSVGGLIKLDRSSMSINDGLFEVTLVKTPKNIFELNNLIAALLRGTPADSPLVQFFNAPSLDVRCPNGVAWTVDGEDAGLVQDAKIQVVPGAIRIAAPGHDNA